MHRLARPLPLLVLLAITLVALALRRPVDHDESQYVAAAMLSADGWLPYRDYAYLQTPLQPLTFAPLAWAFGDGTWPGLRIVNALLGAVVVAGIWRAMRAAGVEPRTATIAAGLLATCDILLFSAGTARNDALPAALLAVALAPMIRAERSEGSRGGAVLVGLLLACAAAAKVSYALPAAAYGVYALAVRRHRPLLVLLGAVPPAVLVAALAAGAPEGFLFGTLTFPAEAPAEYYAAAGRLWKLSLAARAVDTLKFLALGPALLALIVCVRRIERKERLLALLTLAGAIAAVLPAPTWRQYWLPALPPLFVWLALRWQAQPPGRNLRIAAVVFAVAGLAPSVESVIRGGSLADGMAATRALAAQPIAGPVATLSPQLLPAATPLDRRFAPGPFYFRSAALLTAPEERRLHLLSRARLTALHDSPPAAILVGGEGHWSSGDDALDATLERWAVANGWPLTRRIGRFRLYVAPRAAIASR